MTRNSANIILMSASIIWGFSFIFQKEAFDYIDAFAFNGYRFLFGALIIYLYIKFIHAPKQRAQIASGPNTANHLDDKSGLDEKSLAPTPPFKGAFAAGLFLFGGSGFQQMGIEHTSLANAGFITGLYIVFIPIIGLFIGHRYRAGVWIALLIAIGGLYLLSGMSGLHLAYGDFLILICAISFAFHVLVVDHMANNSDPVQFAMWQFIACAIFSLIAAAIIEDRIFIMDLRSLQWILLSGVFAVGLGYTFQVQGQTAADPAQASVILSLESVFAAIAGYLYYQEVLPFDGYIGCMLMLAGCLMVQFFPPLERQKS